MSTKEERQVIFELLEEGKINILFGGHYETETWGVKALMPLLKNKFGVEVEFIDVQTPF